MSFDSKKNKKSAALKIQVVDGRIVINQVKMKKGGRLRRGRLDELLRLQRIVDATVAEMLLQRVFGGFCEEAVEVPVGSWIFYRNLQKALFLLKKGNPKYYELLIVHIIERVEKNGNGEVKNLKVKVDKILAEVLAGNLAVLARLAARRNTGFKMVS